MTIRFLEKSEYRRTMPLYQACFEDDAAYLRYYYGAEGQTEPNEKEGAVYRNRIAVLEDEDSGQILSMVHIQPMRAVYEDQAESVSGRQNPSILNVSYLMCIATAPDQRHKGYMDQVMKTVMATLQKEGEAWCFLIAVNKTIYRHLDFSFDWLFNPEEAEMLAADDGLTDCSAALLNAGAFQQPSHLALREV